MQGLFDTVTDLKRKYPAWALLAVIKYIEGLPKASKTYADYHTHNALTYYEWRCKEADKESEEGSLGKCVMVNISLAAHNRTREIFNKIHETKTCLPAKYLERI